MKQLGTRFGIDCQYEGNNGNVVVTHLKLHSGMTSHVISTGASISSTSTHHDECPLYTWMEYDTYTLSN